MIFLIHILNISDHKGLKMRIPKQQYSKLEMIRLFIIIGTIGNQSAFSQSTPQLMPERLFKHPLKRRTSLKHY